MGSRFSRVLWYHREFGSLPPVLGFPQWVKRLLWISATFPWKSPTSHVEPKNALNLVSWPAWMFSSARKCARESWSPLWNRKCSEELGILSSSSSLLITWLTSAFPTIDDSSIFQVGNGWRSDLCNSIFLPVASCWSLSSSSNFWNPLPPLFMMIRRIVNMRCFLKSFRSCGVWRMSVSLRHGAVRNQAW